MDLTKVPLNEYGHVQTRDGRPVRLLCVDAKRQDPIIGLTERPGNAEEQYASTWFPDGSYCFGELSNEDLIPVQRKHTVSGWLCLYKDGQTRLLSWEPCRKDAKIIGIIAMKPITVELTEGEGL